MSAAATELDIPAARRLAAYAIALRLEDLPTAVVERIKVTIADTLIAVAGGVGEPAGIALESFLATRPSGRSAILDGSGRVADSATAALANGVFAHAAEADSLRRPGAGVHPGATIVPAALALAQEQATDGRTLIEAVTAGVEVMFRIGRATHHTCEQRGFHAPGLTGPFGATVAAARILGLDAEATTHAMGLAGSFAGGLLAFAASSEETTVKPLHIGRAAESGVLAARLAASGMRGPATVLEGRFGFLEVYCTDSAPGLLVSGLGEHFESFNICLKAYPCHISAHAPITGMLKLRQRHGITGADIHRIELTVSDKTASLNAIYNPADTGLARYSVPFSTALALADDPTSPEAWTRRLHDQTILDLAARVDVRARSAAAGIDPWSCAIEVTLVDGRRLTMKVDDFPGTPSTPFTLADLERKLLGFVPVACRLTAIAAMRRLLALEEEVSLDWLTHRPEKADSR
jgi:2-methylcitrate dehydratase PrpD